MQGDKPAVGAGKMQRRKKKTETKQNNPATWRGGVEERFFHTTTMPTTSHAMIDTVEIGQEPMVPVRKLPVTLHRYCRIRRRRVRGRCIPSLLDSGIATLLRGNDLCFKEIFGGHGKPWPASRPFTDRCEGAIVAFAVGNNGKQVFHSYHPRSVCRNRCGRSCWQQHKQSKYRLGTQRNKRC
jgi:hypothetical protein